VSELPLITSEDFDALSPEWPELFTRVPTVPPFLHPEWHRVWLRHFGRETAPVFLSIRRDAELVGVAAFDMHREEARELGDPNVRDYGGPLALPGEELAIASGIMEWLREDLTPGLTFWGLPADAAMTAAVAEAANASGWSLESIAEGTAPGVVLPADFESFVASLSKHDRHEIRRKLRHLEAAGSVQFETSEEPGDSMGDLFHLMRISRDDKDEFLTPAMENFFRDVAQAFSALGMLRLGRLTLDGQLVAMTMSFESGGTTYLYNSGYDSAHVNLAVGLASKAYAIREAVARGQTRFDFLRGNETYKHHLGGIPREIVTLRLRS
jgi:CelD/BcsL family acetyltransferase involved in cellulose biosynthesis